MHQERYLTKPLKKIENVLALKIDLYFPNLEMIARPKRCFYFYYITAHIRRKGKVLFSQRSVCSHGGYSISIPRYFHWSHVLSRGYPSHRSRFPSQGVPQSQVGVPHVGVPPARNGVPPGRDGVSPQIGQHREYLLRGRRYASYAHHLPIQQCE